MRLVSTPAKPLIPKLLSSDEIVSLSFRLYRHYLPTYTRLLKNEKCKGKASSVLTRLLFCDLQGNQQETTEVALEHVMSRISLWKTITQKLARETFVHTFVVVFLVSSLGGLFALLFYALLEFVIGSDLDSFLDRSFSLYFMVVYTLGSSIASSRFYLLNPVMLLELDLEKADAVMLRVRQLMVGSNRRVFLTVWLAMMAIWPLWLPLFGCLALALILMSMEQIPVIYKIIAWGLAVLVGIPVGRVTAPLHCILKTVLYYDLRSRREGIDLQLVSR